MSASELKLKIIEKILGITDKSILEEISRYVGEEAVEKGLDDIKRAESILQKKLIT